MFCEKCGNRVDENANFCQRCGHDLSGAKAQVSVPLTPTKENGKKSSTCSVMSIAFAAVGLIPLLNFIFLPVAIILAIIGFATGKNKGEKVKIASAIVVAASITISLLWIIPANIGSSSAPSNDDLQGGTNTPISCSHSYMLKTTEATCLSAGYATYECSLCGETKKEYKSALGHSWVENKCTRCGETKYSEMDAANNNILTIEQFELDVNSAGGVEPSITFTNRTDKQIAYIYFTVKFYDRMGSPAYCSIWKTHTKRLQLTGPINPGEQDTRSWEPAIYNSSTAVIRPLTIEIEFTDGTKQTMVCSGRYWHTKSYYGGELKD